MKKRVCYISLIFFLFLVSSNSYAQANRCKNIVFMIGDGMGINQVYAAMSTQTSPMHIERFDVIGMVKTYSANEYTTDSGAAGTALACGVKTNNGMIGLAADSIAQPSIMHIAHKNGLATGLVVTCNVTHATPASFVAHQVSRKMTEDIAADYLLSGIDVFIGGGRNDFEQRTDNINLAKQLKDKGYSLCYSLAEIEAVKAGKIAGLLADNHLPKAKERGGVLYKATAKALDLLNQNATGFFLMIEGSQIDWAGHDNDLDYLLDEVRDFDKTIGLVLDFAKKDGNTLVIVTADHETGGLVLNDGDLKAGQVKASFTSLEHTGMPVPVFAYGPGANSFGGFMENTSFFRKCVDLWQFNIR